MTCIERTYLKNICFNIRAFLKKITTVTFLTISLIGISNTAYASFEYEDGWIMPFEAKEYCEPQVKKVDGILRLKKAGISEKQTRDNIFRRVKMERQSNKALEKSLWLFLSNVISYTYVYSPESSDDISDDLGCHTLLDECVLTVSCPKGMLTNRTCQAMHRDAASNTANCNK